MNGQRLYAYTLAKEMGIWDVEEWLERMSARQFKLWQVYEQMMAQEAQKGMPKRRR